MGLSSVRALLVGSVRLSASGPVDPAVTWERYERYDRWPTWSPQLRRVETDGAVLTTGATGQVVGPLGVRAGFVVTEVDEERRRWSWTVRAAGVSIGLEHGVDAGEDGGSATWLVLRGPTPIVLGYAPVAWIALHRLVTLRPTVDEGQ
jgi:hypothetical protein